MAQRIRQATIKANDVPFIQTEIRLLMQDWPGAVKVLEALTR